MTAKSGAFKVGPGTSRSASASFAAEEAEPLAEAQKTVGTAAAAAGGARG
jgi:hypothetical protein